MSASPSASSASGVRKEDLVRPVPLLLRLLQSVGAKSDTFTVQQVIHHLGQYIKTKQLYDKQRQHIVHCKGDPLGEVFGVESFSLKEPSSSSGSVGALLAKALFIAATDKRKDHTGVGDGAVKESSLAAADGDNKQVALVVDSVRQGDSPHGGSTSTPMTGTTTVAAKRRRDSECGSGVVAAGSPEEEDSGAKRPRAPSPAPPCWNDDDQGVPWWFLRSLPHTLDRVSTASSTDICSRRGYETAVVTDSSDDLWFLDESNSDQFSVEFEVESIHSEDYDGEGEDGESGERSSDDEVYDVTVIYSDSQSSYNESSDAEFPEEDGWRCTECSETNHPMHGYCQRCWCLRKDWLPDAAQQQQQQQEQQQQQQQHTTTTTTTTLPTTMGSPAAPRGVFTMPGIATALLEEALARDIDSDDGHDEIDGRRSKKAADEDDEYEKVYEKVYEKEYEKEEEAGMRGPSGAATHTLRCGSEDEQEPEEDEYEEDVDDDGKMKKSSKSEALQPADVVSAASSASASSAYQNDGRSGSGGANNACTLLDMCIICQHEPRSCTIVHGKTGHLVTCYMCAKKLKRRNKPCPVCRSPIQAVIKTYLL
nr:E3 ubiquitin-protein ligase Mdm2-like isoform X2 [Petromyzon marinus]XP_032827363.1 E3 ubiquitin-protein ligase Mdm2-like isoform X2 [Petromyzon marinus]